MHRISGLPEIERPVFGQKASFLWPGQSGRIAGSAWSAVEDSTIIVVEVADELPRLRHRVRLRKVSNATKLPANSGLHPASRTASIERAAPSHLNYFSEQKYCLPGLPSGIQPGRNRCQILNPFSRASARLRGKVSLTEPGSIHALIIKGIRQARRARHAQFAGHFTEERISKVGY